MRVAVHTLGCRVNTADSMALEEAFRAEDVQLVSREEPADVFVLNSCTVTHTADADARKLARRFKRANPRSRVVVTGCYAQVSPDDLRAIPEIDLVLGNNHKPQLVDLVMSAAQAAPAVDHGMKRPTRRTKDRVWDPAVRPARSHITAMPESRSRPFLKVQDGCDYSCAFCIIPKARGVSRSAALEDIAHQAMRYADLGAVELVLTGIHLGHWGRDLAPRRTFADMVASLLERVAADGRIKRVRLGSVEPNEVTEALLDLVADHPLLCEHLHIPLQSGDDGVLKAMRRLYSAAEYRDVLERARERLPDAALGADVLVGHPGEDDAAYQQTLQLVQQLDLTYLHVFPWSPRKGTVSATLPGAATQQAKRARVQQLVRLSAAKRHFFHRRFIGKALEVVTLQVGERHTTALSRNYITMRADNNAMGSTNQHQPGVIARWNLTEAGAERCAGQQLF